MELLLSKYVIARVVGELLTTSTLAEQEVWNTWLSKMFKLKLYWPPTVREEAGMLRSA